MDSQPRTRPDLDLDWVLSEGQLARWYGRDLSSFAWVRAVLTQTVKSRSVRTYRFAHNGRFGQAQGFVLRHLAGVAEMRHILKVQTGWQVDPNPVHSDFTPDAQWQQESGLWAMEYDAGYDLSKVRAKAAAFAQGYAGQIWGVAKASRVATLEKALKGVAVQIVFAPWW